MIHDSEIEVTTTPFFLEWLLIIVLAILLLQLTLVVIIEQLNARVDCSESTNPKFMKLELDLVTNLNSSNSVCEIEVATPFCRRHLRTVLSFMLFFSSKFYYLSNQGNSMNEKVMEGFYKFSHSFFTVYNTPKLGERLSYYSFPLLMKLKCKNEL